MRTKRKLKVASLFSGCGGMDLGLLGGFEYLGRFYKPHPAEIVYAIDNDEPVCRIYNENFGEKAVCEDIKNVKASDIPPHHILIGGFPCQSFSIVAQNPPRLGYKDENGRLFFDMCRVLKGRKPAAFIAENVKGILSANRGEAFPLIIKEFEEAGYHVTHEVLNAADYGIPQKRERVFILGFKSKKALENLKFPRPTTKTERAPLSAVLLPHREVERRFYFSVRAVNGLKEANKKQAQMNKGRVQDINTPSNTVGAHLAKVSINSTDPVLRVGKRYRMFTPLEVARIQSFPDELKLPGTKTTLYKALGNAVPPVLMWHLTREVLRALESGNKTVFSSFPYRTAKEKRSYNMSRIKNRDTVIEKVLRKALWAKGLRFKTNDNSVKGKPDIVFKSKKVAVFCDSEFWHGRRFDEDTFRIQTRQDYWKKKIKSNIERDEETTEHLESKGWEVLRFWESQIHSDLDSVVEEIQETVESRSA